MRPAALHKEVSMSSVLFVRRLVVASAVASGLFAATATVGQGAPASAPASPTTPAADLPSAEQIIAWSLEAAGGKEALEKIESSHAVASGDIPGAGKLSLEFTWAKPDKARIMQSMEGFGDATMFRNGAIAWGTNPMTGGVELLEDAQRDELSDQASMSSVGILTMKDDYPKLETAAVEDFGGQQCWRVHAVDKQENEHEFYFSTESKHLVGHAFEQEGPMGPMDVSLVMSEWKAFDGITTFTKLSLDQMGMSIELVIDKIEFNKVDGSVFAVPAEVQAMVDQKKADETGGATGAGAGDDNDDDGDGGE